MMIVAALVASLTFIGCEKYDLDFKNATGEVNEKCSPVGVLTVVQNANQVWEVQNDGKTLYHFPNELEAKQTKAILEYYKVEEACQCGTDVLTTPEGKEVSGSGIMLYQKDKAGLGIGDNQLNTNENNIEDCLPFNPKKLVVQKVDGNWTLVEKPGHLMFQFGDNYQECVDALNVIKKYGYNQSCFIGRANGSFEYLKRLNPQVEKIPNFNSTQTHSVR